MQSLVGIVWVEVTSGITSACWTWKWYVSDYVKMPSIYDSCHYFQFRLLKECTICPCDFLFLSDAAETNTRGELAITSPRGKVGWTKQIPLCGVSRIGLDLKHQYFSSFQKSSCKCTFSTNQLNWRNKTVLPGAIACSR